MDPRSGLEMREMKDNGPYDWYRDAFDEYYAGLYSHRDKEEASEFVRTLGAEFYLPGARVLDVACGAGRHVEALSKSGAEPVGTDLSAALLREAQLETAAPLVRADMRYLPFGPKVFHGAISMFTSFGYFSHLEDEVAVLGEIRRVLVPDGWFVIDYMNSAFVRGSLDPRSVREVGGLRVIEERSVDRDGIRVIKRVRLFDGDRMLKEHVEAVRLLDRRDLSGMLEATGIKPLRFMGDYSGGAFSEKRSERMIALCRRR